MHFDTYKIYIKYIIYKLYNVYKQHCLVRSALEALALILVMIMITVISILPWGSSSRAKVFGNLLFPILSGIAFVISPAVLVRHLNNWDRLLHSLPLCYYTDSVYTSEMGKHCTLNFILRQNVTTLMVLMLLIEVVIIAYVYGKLPMCQPLL